MQEVLHQFTKFISIISFLLPFKTSRETFLAVRETHRILVEGHTNFSMSLVRASFVSATSPWCSCLVLLEPHRCFKKSDALVINVISFGVVLLDGFIAMFTV